MTTWAVDTEITAGGPCDALATADFLMTFFGLSEVAGVAPSSYGFLFTVLFVKLLEERWELN